MNSIIVHFKLLFAPLFSLPMMLTGYGQMIYKALIDKYFDRLAEKNKAMGTLIISNNGKAIYFRSISYGMFSKTVKISLSDVSRYLIALVIKLYAAIIILQLIE